MVTPDTDFIILITFNEVLESYIEKLHAKRSKFVSAPLRRVITSSSVYCGNREKYQIIYEPT